MAIVTTGEFLESLDELISRVKPEAYRNLDHSEPTDYSLLSQIMTLSTLGIFLSFLPAMSI